MKASPWSGHCLASPWSLGAFLTRSLLIADLTVRQENQELRLSDLEDLEEEEEEADEEEAVAAAADRLAGFPTDVQLLPAPDDRLQRRQCGLVAPRFSFSEPPGSGEVHFVTTEPGGPTLTTHYPRGEKPRIWSLAHTAAAGALEGAPAPRPAPRSPECHMIPGQPPRSSRQSAIPTDSIGEQSARIAKAFGNPAFALQGLPLNCAPCPRRREPAVQCPYPASAEGSGPPTALGAPVTASAPASCPAIQTTSLLPHRTAHPSSEQPEPHSFTGRSRNHSAE